MHNPNAHFLNRTTLGDYGLMVYERALAECLRHFLSELFYTNAGVVIGYVHANQDSNLNDLIASSAELSLRPGLLRYGQNATISTDWGRPPEVALDMVLHHPALTIYFRVEFDGKGVGVSIEGIVCTEPLGAADENFRRFQDVLTDCRLPA